MKKLITTSVCALALAGSALAQGNVNWSTFSGGALQVKTNGTAFSSFVASGGTLSGGNGAIALGSTFYGELLYANSSTALALPTSLSAFGSTWIDTGLQGISAASAGLMVGNPTTTSTAVPWASGVAKAVIYVAWSSNLGTTWTAALAALNSQSTLAGLTAPAYFGVTGNGTVNSGVLTPNSANPGTTVFATGAIKDTSMQLYQVGVTPAPEPGTMALAALGGASLLLFRRRK